MVFYKTEDYYDMSRKAANLLSAQIIMKPDCVLGLATGSSPTGIYKQLQEWYQKGDLDFSKVRTVNLDEYKGLNKDNVYSYYYYMNQTFFKDINIDIEQTYIPDGMAIDDQKECERYDLVIQKLGGIDMQLLGLGHNGHIGFNEPGQVFKTGTHCVALTTSTIEANSRLFHHLEEVPRYAYTVGMQTIIQARKIVLVVSGVEKADIVKTAFFGAVTPNVPASILQLHKDVIIVGDKAAFSKIDV